MRMTDDPAVNVHQFPLLSILSLWTKYFQQSAFRSFPLLSGVILVPDTGRDRGYVKNEYAADESPHCASGHQR
jgi:hypothetical protein